jgi:K+-transporting ATPase ATPase C chain
MGGTNSTVTSRIPLKPDQHPEHNMKKHILTAVLYTAITAILLGIGYPLVITAIARVAFPAQANGELLKNANGDIVGSKLIGQAFTGAKYFHSRPSAAGTGYDASSSGGSNLGPTNKALADRVQASVVSEGGTQVPVDLVTTSGSGLDPDITPAAASFQISRIAAQRGLSEQQVNTLIDQHTTGREFGFFGEPRVNVLELNLALDKLSTK